MNGAAMTTNPSPRDPQRPALGPQQGFSISPPQLTLLVVCIVSVYFVVGFYGKSVDSYRINQRAARIQRDIARLEAENKLLQDKVAYLATDAYLETAARDKLNLARPGDRALVVVPAQVEVPWVEPPPRPDPYGVPAEFGHAADWLALFFGPR